MSFVTRNTGQFPYFNAQLDKPEWRGKTVLDFGGNTGNILHHPDSTIDHEGYWCIDLSKDAIEIGKKACPKANFVFYDRYNFEFNPTGVVDLPIPDTGMKFDYIIASSVFTHTGKGEMLRTTDHLRSLLAPGGRLAFTFHEPHYVPPNGVASNLNHYLNLRIINPYRRLALAEKGRNATWCTLAYRDLYVENEDLRAYALDEQGAYLTFYASECIARLFPDGEIREPIPPFDRHHCCILR
jgi:SAM-dependent methyltransferase